MADPLAHPAVRRVQAALEAAGSDAQVIALASTARSAEDAAQSIGTPLGSIVKSLVFTVGGAPVMALIAGDRRCDTAALAGALGREGRARRADADAVRDATGFAIGGVRRPGGARGAASRCDRRELRPLRDRLRRRRPPALRLCDHLG